ncbi:MAG: UDP-N-acetylmuramoyl-L-alanine--D-glutamate ligase [Halocynthiibacter sp.]
MIPVQGYVGLKVGVLGLGRSGLATAAALEAGGAEPILWDDNADARAKAEAMEYELRDFTRQGAFDDITVFVVSPGIPHLYPSPNKHIAAAMAAGVPVNNDIGLFFRSFATHEWDDFDVMPKVIAVTGSNGKSTTSALIHHILEEAGRPTQLAGNIGRGVLDIDPAHDGEVVVLELSSYQTELARELTPDVAVFTNLSPDHLDRHHGMGGYFAAKRRLFSEGGPDRAVVGVEEPEGVFLANQLCQGPSDERVIRVSTATKLTGQGWNVMAKKGFLSETRKGKQVSSIDLRGITALSGVHNHQNACSAYAAVRSLGIGPRVIERAFHSFGGLPHRTQIIGVYNGVTFVNDSKATNVESAIQALNAFENIHWIAGGLAKEGGLGALTDHLDHVKKAYLIGHSADAFALELSHIAPEVSVTMARAVEAAVANAVDGDVVLLAPAAASFDQYPNFEKRGDAFISAVLAQVGV